MMPNKEELLQKVSNAREALSQGVETAQGLHDPNDKLNALKTSYQIATSYIPDNTKHKTKLYLINIDTYMNKLHDQRVDNLYKMQLHKTPARVERDKVLHRRQNALIEFQKYCLVHGRVYQDNIAVIDDHYHIIKISADQFYDYLRPYQQFLQKEFLRLRPDIKQ